LGVIREVLTVPHATLIARCDPVTQFNGGLGALAMDLLQTLYAANGRGLAAPQIGVTQRIFVTDTGWKEGAPRPMVFVNPGIIGQSAEQATASEACLSIPGAPADVTRPTWVDLRWQDLAGVPCEGRFTGFDARCIQHERDHLDGILITGQAA